MAKNPLASYNWFASDWLGSRAHAVMTLEQQGAYRNLLDHAWESDPPCSLPDDDEELAQLSGAGERWPTMAHKIRHWFTLENGRLWNLRMREGFDKAITTLSAKKLAGKLGGEKRAEELRRLKESVAVLQATVKQTSSKTEALLKPPTPTSTEEKKDSVSSKRAAEPPRAPQEPASPDPVKDLFDAGVVLLAGSGMKRQNAAALIGQLRKHHGDEQAFALIQQAGSKTEPKVWLCATLKGGSENGKIQRGTDWEAEERSADAYQRNH